MKALSNSAGSCPSFESFLSRSNKNPSPQLRIRFLLQKRFSWFFLAIARNRLKASSEHLIHTPFVFHPTKLPLTPKPDGFLGSSMVAPPAHTRTLPCGRFCFERERTAFVTVRGNGVFFVVFGSPRCFVGLLLLRIWVFVNREFSPGVSGFILIRNPRVAFSFPYFSYGFAREMSKSISVFLVLIFLIGFALESLKFDILYKWVIACGIPLDLSGFM